ncbi:hypothetical protein [Microbacterium lacticum]
MAPVLCQHPQAETPGRRHAGEHDGVPRRGDQFGVGAAERDPSAPHAHEHPRIERAGDAGARMARADQRHGARDALAGPHGLGQRAQSGVCGDVHPVIVARGVA